MRRSAVDVGGYDIGLYLVTVHIGPRASMVDGIEQGEQRRCLVALAECGECHDRPQRGMRILAAVLADAWRVTFDVAWIDRRFVEWRREQQRHAIQRPDQLAFDGHHGASGPPGLSRTRDRRPGLGD